MVTNRQFFEDGAPQPGTAVHFYPPADEAYRPLVRVQVAAWFWGSQWGSDPRLREIYGGMTEFLSIAVTGDLLASLNQYSLPGGEPLLPGQFVNVEFPVIDADVPPIVDDEWIRKLIFERVVVTPQVNHKRDSLYFLLTPPNVEVVRSGQRSCVHFCAYHGMIGTPAVDAPIPPIFYAVVPYPGCSGCGKEVSILQSLTAITSAELINAVTDPVYGWGWFDPSHGEVADVTAGQTESVTRGMHQFRIRQVWSRTGNQG